MICRTIRINIINLKSIYSIFGFTYSSIIDRLCPSGYFYAGDDTPAARNALEGYWPINETPKYSCYKVIPNVSGINKGLQKCYTSTIADEMEARVVIFEDSQEIQRVFSYLFNEQSLGNINNGTLLTSAIYFEDVQEWLYLGTSKLKWFFNLTIFN